MKRPLLLRFKSWVISITAGLMNRNSVANLVAIDLQSEPGLRENVAWWIEEKLGQIYAWAYQGSDEEIVSVHAQEIPIRFMSLRQKIELFDCMSQQIVVAECSRCTWKGDIVDAVQYLWPHCERPVYPLFTGKPCHRGGV